MNIHNRGPDGLSVLVLASSKKDAELTVQVLGGVGFAAESVSQFQELSVRMLDAGVIIFSEECLTKNILAELREKIASQPSWSDLPIIMMTSGGSASTESNQRMEWIAQHLQNVTLLERPVRLATLITIVRTALSSRRKQYELKVILEDLEKSKKIAEESNNAKSLFLANMSHEIRTPLAAIVGFAGLMRDQNLPKDERLQFADAISRNGDQLSNLINDILDLSKVEAGKLDVEQVEISFPGFIADVTSWLRPSVEKKGLEFRVLLKSQLPEIVKADTTRVRQVLLNLISNAVKFTAEGIVSLSVEAELGEGNQSNLIFEVSDSGIGMSVQDQERLFKPFSQADSSMTRRFGGTGLGLVLSRALARAMNGDLQLINSEVGKGSCFEFRLSAEVIAKASGKKTDRSIPKDALKGMNVLLAEDSPDNQFLMNRYLKAAGAEVTTVANGELAIAQALEHPFDVILMDIQMPVVDGLSATRELRGKGYKKPIIALTAHALREERERSLTVGCNEHLTKPIERELLIEIVASYRSAL